MEKTALYIKTSTGHFSVDTSTIVRVEASSNYSRVYFSNGKVLVTAKVLKWFEEKLQHQQFVRLHRSHLINNNFMHCHHRITREVEMKDGAVIQVSKRRKKAVWTKFFALILTGWFIQTEVAAQNVGIGTINPLYTADVLDSTSGTVLRLRTASTTAGDRTLLRFTTSTGNSTNGFNSSYLGNERQSIGTALVFGTANSNSLAPTEKMRLSEDGFLGIGTTNPQARLHIDMSNISTTTQAMIINDDDDPLVNFQRNNTNYGFLQVLGTDFKIGTTINNDVGNFVIRTNGADRAWFTAGGRVGLGTSTPATQLHMTGELTMQSSNPVIQMKDAAGDDKAFIQMVNGDDMVMGTNTVNTTGSFIIRNNGANRLTVTNNGYVGIGTTSPQADLHIENSILPNPITINTVGQRFIQFQRSGLPRTYFKFENDDISMGTYDNTSGRVIFETEEADRMIIHANGKISINANYTHSNYQLAVRGDILCEDIQTFPFASWPDYVFKSDYQLKPLPEVEAFIKRNGRLPGIPAAAEVEKNGIMLGEMQRKTMEKIEELTLYIIELKKEIEALKNKK